jgi:2-aminoadipate transaminase
MPAWGRIHTGGLNVATIWESRFAQRKHRMGRSVIRELLKYTLQPDIISFAGGLPAAELFPTERTSEAACRLLAEQGTSALQYGPTEGYPPLRVFLAEQMRKLGVPAQPDNILVTAGSQQALDLVGKALIDPGDKILVEAPTYLGALQAWNAYEADYDSLPIDDDGMIVDKLEEALQRNPKFAYVLPNFQNPGGTTMARARRDTLVQLSKQYQIPVVEDDPYGALRFEGEDVPSLIGLDAALHGNTVPVEGGYTEGNVIYMGTFSKTLSPGLRIGWLCGPMDFIDQTIIGKQGADLHTNAFAQMMIYEVAKDGFLEEHIGDIRRVYGERRKVMLSALERYFPEGCSWTRPQGGLFLWARTPEFIDTAELLKQAIEKKVAFVPGFAFYPDSSQKRCTMRLNFSCSQPAQIEEGIRRLGTLIKDAIAAQKVAVKV